MEGGLSEGRANSESHHFRVLFDGGLFGLLFCVCVFGVLVSD